MNDSNQALEDNGALRNIAKGASINLVGNVSRTVLALAFTFFIARVLDARELGIYFLAISVVTLLVRVAVFGLDNAVVRYTALFNGQGDAPRARGTVVSSLILAVPFALLIALISFLLAPFLAEYVFHDEGFILVMRLMSLMIPIYVAATLLCAGTQGLGLMQYTVYSRDLGEQFVRILSGVILVLLGGSLFGVIYGSLMGATFFLAASVWWSQRKMRVFSGITGRTLGIGTLMAFAAPLALASVLDTLLRWSDSLLLGYLGTSEEVGLYGVPVRIGVFGTVVLISFSTMFAPIISDLTNRKLDTELRSFFRTVTKWIIALSLPGFLIILLFAGDILSLFGSEFREAATAFIILSTGQFVNAATGPVILMLTMSGHPRLELMNTTICTVLNIGLCLLLIPGMGIVGAAIASAVGIGLSNIFRLIEVYILLGMHPYVRSTIKPLLAGILVTAPIALIFFFLPGIGSIVKLLTGSILLVTGYLAALMLMGLDEKDKEILSAIKFKITGLRMGT